MDSKDVTAVTDNAANIVAAVRVAGLRHFRCAAHTLNLVVVKAIEQTAGLKELRAKIRTIVNLFRSDKYQRGLVNVQKYGVVGKQSFRPSRCIHVYM